VSILRMLGFYFFKSKVNLFEFIGVAISL